MDGGLIWSSRGGVFAKLAAHTGFPVVGRLAWATFARATPVGRAHTCDVPRGPRVAGRAEDFVFFFSRELVNAFPI